MSSQPDLSIIIPAFQEAAVIESTLRSLADYLHKHPFGNVEVIVVVAESPDDTAKIALEQADFFDNFKVLNAGVRVGKGRDVRYGIFEASGQYKLFMDADLATPLHHLESVRSIMATNAPIGIAVRDLLVIHSGLSRKLMSKLANLAAQLFATPGIIDTQCGFKVFRADVADELFARQSMLKWSFDMEILAIAKYLGYPITSFKISDWHDPKPQGLAGDSQLQIVLKGFLDPVKIRKNIILRRYKAPNYIHTALPEYNR
jgi:dolichyl-phosphate beta-glucosyltransferase